MTTMNNRLTAEELKKLRQTDFGKKPGFETADTMLISSGVIGLRSIALQA